MLIYYKGVSEIARKHSWLEPHLTSLTNLPSSCLIRLPIRSFWGGNYKNSWSTLLKGSQQVRFHLTLSSWLRRDIVLGLVNEDNLYEWEILIIGWVHELIVCSSWLWSRCRMQTTWYCLVRFGDLVSQFRSFIHFLLLAKEGSFRLYFRSHPSFLCYHRSCDSKRRCGIQTVSM